LCAHDAVAQKDFYPHLPEIPVEVDEDEETIKIVQLVKSVEPLVKLINFMYTYFKSHFQSYNQDNFLVSYIHNRRSFLELFEVHFINTFAEYSLSFKKKKLA
jgi:hypothetical protein